MPTHCSTCGEPLSEDHLCGVCFFAGALDNDDSPPETIGHYRIRRMLGEGGMGTVYEAEQEQPHRTVALKVIKPGLVGTQLIRRFAQESEALARLHHPGIAQVYEAGTADNGFGPQPYFAMEFIRGEPVDQYIASYLAAHGADSSLAIRERLRIMIEICDAVQHAHQRGIIHRDLKPANILVDETAHPKILDFGVARVTDSDAKATRQTDMGQLMGTLAYMSPEQVLADPLELDTRSDVYALGVIFYQLLAGRMPYQVMGNVHQAAQAIRDEEPSSLGSLNRHYRGDIETIVAKALEKDKSRRYASAADLGSDLRRHLEDQPILARRPTATYHLAKFARRHTALVAGVAGIFLVLIAGIIVSTMQANRARLAQQAAGVAQRMATEERDRALAAERRADQASANAVASEARALQARDRAMRERQRADTEAATAKAVSQFLQHDLLAQASNGVQASPGTRPDPDLKIRTALDRAAARIGGKFADKPQVEASIRSTIANSYHDLGLFQEAHGQLEKALELRNRSLGPNHPATLATTKELAIVLRDEGKYAQCEQLLSKVLDAERRVLGKHDPETLSTMSALATAYRLMGKFQQAEPLLAETLAWERRTLGDEHPDTLNTMGALGNLYNKNGKHTQSAQTFVRLIEISRRVRGPEHPTTVASMNDLANAYQSLGDFTSAERLYLEVREIQRRVRGEEHPNTLLTLGNLALVYRNEGKLDQSEALYLRLLEVAPRVFGKEHPRTLAIMDHLAALYREQQKYPQSEALWATVVEARHRVLGPQHPDTIKVLAELGLVRIELHKYAEAEPLLRESLAAHEKSVQEKGTPDSALLLHDQILLGECLAGESQYAKAEPLLLSGYEALLRRTSARTSEALSNKADLERFYLEETPVWIAQLYQDWGKPDKAAVWTQTLTKTRLAANPK